MCGIAGILNYEMDNHVDIKVLKNMTDKIYHRGPDGDGFYLNNNVGLGNRRLSIIDLNNGTQPIYNEDNKVVIVFNGEIYNYIELREELIKLKHHFRTNSDTEVIVHAYEQWGTKCLDKLNGCWAFAIWDENIKQLFIARDRIGEKPLFYSQLNNAVIFASEIKSLLAYGLPYKLRLDLLEIYLSLSYIPAPLSFFESINKLEPGHYLLIKDGKTTKSRYWDLPEIDERNMLSDKNKIYEEFQFLLSDSVKLRMRADVPYGAFLSGGLDSSSIVAIMSETSKYPVETFTIGFNEKEFDESRLALQVAQKFNTIHHQFSFDHSIFYTALQEAVTHFDEPFGDYSSIPTNFVCKYARNNVKMVLTGDGGDEVLSGYPTYQIIDLGTKYRKIPYALRKTNLKIIDIVSSFNKGKPRYILNRGSKILSAFELDFESSLIQKFSWLPVHSKTNFFLFNKEQYPIADFVSEYYKSCPYHDDFYKMMFFNLRISLPDNMLAKLDRISMANSLEARVPFLDYRLIEFLTKVDKRIKIQGFKRKQILRNTFGKDLPPQLLRANKKGFGLPLREWFKSKDLEEDYSQIMLLREVGINPELLADIFKKNKESSQDYGYLIWMFFMLYKVIFKFN